jgi:hypothetical protein
MKDYPGTLLLNSQGVPISMELYLFLNKIYGAHYPLSEEYLINSADSAITTSYFIN